MLTGIASPPPPFSTVTITSVGIYLMRQSPARGEGSVIPGTMQKEVPSPAVPLLGQLPRAAPLAFHTGTGCDTSFCWDSEGGTIFLRFLSLRPLCPHAVCPVICVRYHLKLRATAWAPRQV